jgi:hypothetical protein
MGKSSSTRGSANVGTTAAGGATTIDDVHDPIWVFFLNFQAKIHKYIYLSFPSINVQEAIISKLDIRAHGNLAKVSHKFNELAQRDGSWNCVTALKITNIDQTRASLDIAMANGLSHKSTFTGLMDLVNKFLKK